MNKFARGGTLLSLPKRVTSAVRTTRFPGTSHLSYAAIFPVSEKGYRISGLYPPRSEGRYLTLHVGFWGGRTTIGQEPGGGNP